MEAAEEIRDAAAQKADELKQTALDQAGRFKDIALEKGQQIRDVASEKADTVKVFAEDNLGISGEKIDELKDEAERFVKENPAKTAFIALGLGFLIGRILK